MARFEAEDLAPLRRLLLQEPSLRRPGSGLGFQIAAIDCAPCVLWVVARCHRRRSAAAALARAVAIGGDTDTVASMVGAILGALHGEGWVDPELRDGLEDHHPRGRSHALRLAEQLTKLDLHGAQMTTTTTTTTRRRRRLSAISGAAASAPRCFCCF